VSDPEPSSFFVDLARQAAQAGLSVARSAQAAPLSTKFGLAEIATVTMAGTTEETCLALRIDRPPAQFSLRGWVCGSAAQPASEAQVACLLDRLALVGEDPILGTLFAQAERQRTAGCAPVQPRPASVGSHDVSAQEAEPNVMARIAPSVRPVRPTRLRRL
jgi:hypothetical protein